MLFDKGVCFAYRIRDGLEEALNVASGAIDALPESNLLDGTERQVCRSSDGRMIKAIVVCKSRNPDVVVRRDNGDSVVSIPSNPSAHAIIG